MGWLTDLLKDFPALSVAKERLALQEERFQVLERENANLKRKVIELESSIRNKAAELAVFKSEEIGGLGAEESNVLKCILDLGGGDATAQDVANRLRIDVNKAKYYLEKLQDAEFINARYQMMSPTSFSLAQKGREFLITTGKL